MIQPKSIKPVHNRNKTQPKWMHSDTQCLCISLGLLCHEDVGLQSSVTKIPHNISNPAMGFYQDSSGGYAAL